MKRVYIVIFLTGLFVSMSSYAGLPVVPAKNQQELLQGSSPLLAQNKKIVFDFSRVVLAGLRLDQASRFLSDDYIQHNPNVETGLKGFLDFFSKFGGPRDIPNEIPGLVSMQAEGDYVTLSFVNQVDSPNGDGTKYTTTWFDMFRLKDGKIVEHWDCDTKTR
jgi:predicted SnoaL-like aldol condensation-catalyzing enzyme